MLCRAAPLSLRLQFIGQVDILFCFRLLRCWGLFGLFQLILLDFALLLAFVFFLRRLIRLLRQDRFFVFLCEVLLGLLHGVLDAVGVVF